MNNNCKGIHETVLKDLMDVFDAAKNFVTDTGIVKNSGPLSHSTSIAKAASNLTLIFPVICSKSIDINNACMISKAVEKNAVSMMQRLFSSWQIANAEDASNLQQYINKFHSNLSFNVANLDDVFDFSTRYTNGLSETFTNSNPLFVAQEYANFKSATINDKSNLDYRLPSDISENSLMSYSIKEGAVLYDANSNAKRDIKADSDIFKNQIPDSEYKKANELMPTSLFVNFYVNVPGSDKVISYSNGVVGIKAKLYPIASKDIIDHISERTSNRNWLINLIRATTREISFMKDFVMAVDKAKIDAMSLSTRNSTSDRMWKVLERRATTSRLKKMFGSNNTSAAITTLCVSQEEVEYLKKGYGIDLENISIVKGLFDSLNLMSLCIVDESLEVAKFIFDENEPMWEHISFTHLERESSDNTYKRVVNLMTKMSR